MQNSKTKININKAHFPVTVLGPGRRIGIWLQGCSIGCKNCVSQDTWDATPSRLMTVAQLLTWCKQTSDAQEMDGITISGGEPFDQPAALSALLDGLHQWRTSSQHGFDILCYSGYPLTTLQKNHSAILAKLDALIPEPYIDNKPLTDLWRGSSNQSLQLLSARAEQKYAPYLNNSVVESGKHIQAMLDGKKVWYIGIPARGDMAALEALCQERGVTFDSASWRS
ncbi:4Fe-4S single cluster domain-containing protein [Solimicrobium silvestre]|uniref:4Fe-4S single cluster domain n=1 Tax=Solimicrobium silvestre TaxID=2099400 RepID=A0A2S9GYY2_9BURK|nr:4Fe-4S single cluster domain-containing protein [Solimicrobium silvestre]PRC92898.1 4Fe-4S single cluster domain [Solimicrobium silvestre]